MKRATTLLLVRHGDVAGEGMFHGQVDVPLTERGLERLRALAGRLSGEALDALYCSDLTRAVQSAGLLARGRGVDPVSMPQFRELHMGRWDGLSSKEVWEREPELLKGWWDDVENFTPPGGGESMARLAARVLPALRELIARHRGETICLVAHGGVNRAILLDALGLPLSRFYSLSQEYGCLNRIRYFENASPVLDLMNG